MTTNRTDKLTAPTTTPLPAKTWANIVAAADTEDGRVMCRTGQGRRMWADGLCEVGPKGYLVITAKARRMVEMHREIEGL